MSEFKYPLLDMRNEPIIIAGFVEYFYHKRAIKSNNGNIFISVCMSFSSQARATESPNMVVADICHFLSVMLHWW